MTDEAIPMPLQFTLSVDGKPYPVDLAGATGEDVMFLRSDLGVEYRDLVGALVRSELELPDLVGLMCLSLRQADEPADHRWLLRHVSTRADVEFTFADPTTALAIDEARTVLDAPAS